MFILASEAFLKTKHYSYYLGLVLDLNAKVKP